MSSAPSPQPNLTRYSPALIGAGILVMALGFGLPMLTSGPAPEKANAPRESAAKQAVAASPPAPIQPPSATGLGASLLRLAIGLVVVCGLCVAAARWFGQKPATAPGAMEVLASIEVARCVIHLVRAGERRLLIGTDIGGVKAILELPGTEPEPPDPPVEAASSAPSTEASPLAPVLAPAPTGAPTQEEILKILFKLRAHADKK